MCKNLRKFIVCLIAMGLGSFFLSINHISGAEFVKLISVTVSVFIGGNVLTKFSKNTKKK